jgi:hypothetical protein
MRLLVLTTKEIEIENWKILWLFWRSLRGFLPNEYEKEKPVCSFSFILQNKILSEEETEQHMSFVSLSRERYYWHLIQAAKF